MIDEKEVRNRSHAIEVLIRQSLMPKVSTAAILAGGSLENGDLPPLLTIGSRRLIHITIGHLINHGIRKIFILAGKNEGRIRDVLGDGSSYDASLKYVQEDKEWGTAGAVKLIEHQVGVEPCLSFTAIS
jgi:NDP-sugar pyrophosphorylase family protein